MFQLKNKDPVVCNNMDEHGGHYKWNKPDIER
jgi:hypothetical protein